MTIEDLPFVLVALLGPSAWVISWHLEKRRRRRRREAERLLEEQCRLLRAHEQALTEYYLRTAVVEQKQLTANELADQLFTKVVGFDQNHDITVMPNKEKNRRLQYVIRRNLRTVVMDPRNNRVMGFVCAHIGPVPDSDRRLAEFLLLINDEIEYWNRINFGWLGNEPSIGAARTMAAELRANRGSNGQ